MCFARSNNIIKSGSTSSNNSYGIYLDKGASARIGRNSLIHGGFATNGDTFGIFAADGVYAEIYRNIILGGRGNITAGSHAHHALYFSSSAACDVLNNFIVGGKETTDTDYSC